jgi:ABC-type polar amino acid transport system ATPase subunit
VIKVSKLYKNFGSLEVLKDINTEIEKGEVVVVVGPSGSGRAPSCAASITWRSPPAGRLSSTALNSTTPKTRSTEVRQEGGNGVPAVQSLIIPTFTAKSSKKGRKPLLPKG